MPVDVYDVNISALSQRNVKVRRNQLILRINAGLHHLSTADEGQQMDALLSLRMCDAHDHVGVNS